jgi:hypothetical protein
LLELRILLAQFSYLAAGRLPFRVAVHLTWFAWAKLPHLSQFVSNVSLEYRAFTGSILPTTLVRETTIFPYPQQTLRLMRRKVVSLTSIVNEKERRGGRSQSSRGASASFLQDMPCARSRFPAAPVRCLKE